jgi:hyperosmotically inducible periplasmic protein
MVSLGCRRALPLIAALFVAFWGCARSPSQESMGEYVDDSVITANVKAALAADPRVRAVFIDVQTVRGIVHLTGFADNREEADLAVAIARSVGGVKRVRDDITVRVGGR